MLNPYGRCSIKWFKHDSNAHADTKLKKVRQKYGMVGYGLYWYCIELIAGNVDKNNITFVLEDDAEVIAVDWNLDQLKVEEMMRYFVDIGLFEGESNVITCLKLARRLDDTQSKNPEIKTILARLNQSNSESLGETPNNSAQNRLDKNRLDKNRKEKSTRASPFKPPEFNDVHAYCNQRNNSVNPQKFIDHYTSNGWMVGKNKMKDWKAAVRTWEQNDYAANQSGQHSGTGKQSGIAAGFNDRY